ncbi:MAG: LytTR family DNA-binding domain-containing protein [Cyclobacteriaceae bacterium]
MIYNLRKREFFMVAFWLSLGLVYGLQHYFTYLADGYSCNFAGTTFGQIPNFLIWGFISLAAYQFENGTTLNTTRQLTRDLKFLLKVLIVFLLHLGLLFTMNWLTYGGTIQSAVMDYQQRYVFGWFYFQLLVYSVIVCYYAPSIRNRIIHRVLEYRSTKFLEYFDVTCADAKKRIYVKDVEVINANDYYINIFVLEKKYLIRKSLKEVEVRTDPGIFLRIHRSTIVNINKVDGLVYKNNQWMVRMESGVDYPVSRSKKEKVFEVLNKKLMDKRAVPDNS